MPLRVACFSALCQSASIVAWDGGVGPPAESRGVAFMTFQATALIGRDRELEILSGFLEQAAAEGGAFLFTGETGVGKTVILDVAAKAAATAGTMVLRTAGAEFETEANFAALCRLLQPVLGQLHDLGDLYQRALTVALGLGDGPPADRLVLANAVVALLRQAVGGRPTLLLVDDLPWVDRPSALALGVVARRLAGTRIGFLAVSRLGEEGFFERSGLPGHEIKPLDEATAVALIRNRFPELANRVRARVLAEAQGNPLALLELPAALSEAQRAATQALPRILPLSERLQAMFAARISDLPGPTRSLLLLTALDGTGDFSIVRAAAGMPGLGDLGPAEEARLVQVTGSPRRLSFRHPLTQATVVALASETERRQAHRVLAELAEDRPDRQAWHLAEASTGPDEKVAGLLEQMAYRILRRGDGTGAIAALLRAADLSPGGADRSRRIAAAAYVGADVTGDLRNVPKLLEDARKADPSSAESLQNAMAAAYLLLNSDGDVDTAHRILFSSIESYAGIGTADDDVLIEAMHTLALVCFFGGRAELWAPFEAALARIAAPLPMALTLESKTFADPVRTALPVLDELDAAIRDLAHEVDPVYIVRIGIAADYVDRLAGCRGALRRVVADGRAGGAVTSAIDALMLLFVEAFQSGQWDEAERLADEGVLLCQTHGYRVLTWPGQWGKALLAAVRGDYDTMRALTDEIVRWATPRRLSSVQAYASHVRAVAALGQGLFEEAYLKAAAISPAGVLGRYVPHSLWVLLDLVEASVHTGRAAEAAAHVAAMQDAGVGAISSRLALNAAGATALIAPSEQVADLFAEALAIPEADRWPFDQARVQLLYGEWLRRNRSGAQAREHLSAALNTFRRLGARPWQIRANRELRAVDAAARWGADPEGLRSASFSDPVTLTPMDREIAELAAAGLTNRQIGDRLYLSHRTVAAHLYQIFPRLGITSRAALRDALDMLGESARSDD
jgi:DNA-binding CsgD family transcriptional regulator